MMANVASGIPKTLHDSSYIAARLAGYNLSATDHHNVANMTVGQALVPAVFVKIHWPWLSLSIVVWILAASTWIATLCLTRDAKLRKWRNEILPLLFLYRGQERFHYYGVSSLAFTTRAEDVQARLHVGTLEAKLK